VSPEGFSADAKAIPKRKGRVAATSRATGGLTIGALESRSDTFTARLGPVEPSEEMSDMRSLPLKFPAGAALVLGAGLALAQTTPPTTPKSPPPSAMKPDASKLTLTEAQAKSWIDKPVFSSDGKELGEVAAFKRSADDTVLEMHADMGGMLGIGESRVAVTPSQFKLQNNRVVLSLTAEQAKALPKAKN
jgi:hypothetical protein